MSIPTREDLNIGNSLDEQVACEHFLGKSIQEAERMFQSERNLEYQEDLLWMGIKAFRYYVRAAIDYIHTDAAYGDADFINGLAGTLRHRLHYEGPELLPVADALASLCGYVISHWSTFQVTPNVYEGLHERYVALQDAFEELTRNG